MVKVDLEACLSGTFLGNNSSSMDHVMNSTSGVVYDPYNNQSWLNNASLPDGIMYGTSHVNKHPMLEEMKIYLKIAVNPTLCIFGIIGNILNIVVLTRRRLQAGMDSMERAAHLNLVALAVSDLLYCTFALPRSFQVDQVVFKSKTFWVYYSMYGSCFQNILSKTSTWLTVVMAVGRYAAICHPLRAREFVHVTCTRSAIVVTFLAWTLLHLPQFWNYVLEGFLCQDGSVLYMIELGVFEENRKLNMAFSYTWAIFGFFIPVPLLAYCNACLIRALKESTKMRRQYRVHDTRKSRPGSRITPTLILIVIMYLVLVTPSEIISFMQENLPRKNTEAMLAALEFANLLQTINFASNFVLYCAVNVHFRKTLRDLFYMLICRKQKHHVRTTSWIHQNSKSFITVLSETQM